ncbi:MAG: hypothetical protein EZS28_019004 [Streblomastix strix]|uniref:Uncharacterized protein n=1 Tax=Streblomastix strix TaxID=222440 RepID=A0A5J4VSB0_9EUKA|nr:MAG: hypothetical protein EZS28_019004 [Streblomastix strix]
MVTEQNNNAIHIDTGWDFGSGTGEQQDEFQEDFIDESQLLEIRLLNKKNKRHKPRKHQKGVGQSPWTIVQIDELSGTAREGPRPVKHKTEIVTTHQQKAKDSFSNINNSTELQERQLRFFMHTERLFQLIGNVRKEASSTDSTVSGQVQVAGTKTVNILTAPSAQLQRNPVREPKVEKKGGRTPI